MSSIDGISLDEGVEFKGLVDEIVNFGVLLLLVYVFMYNDLF